MGSDETNDIIERERSLPSVPRSASGEMQTALSAMREQVERISGKIGDPSSRAIRLYDLENGIVARYFTVPDASKTKKPGSGGSRILKAPRNLQYEHMVFAIRLTWENVEEDYAYVEIWCAMDSTVIDDAQKVGIATKPLAEWTHNGVSTKRNYTYWIRAVGWDGSVSPWCPPQGQGGLVVPAPIDQTIEEILDILIGNLTEDHLYQALNERIDLIDGPPDLIGSVAERLAYLQAEIGARITSVQTLLEGADQTLAQRIDTVSAATSSALAAVQTEQTARVNADSAMASQITTLFAQSNNNAAAIRTEQTVRASADSAQATQITQLQTDVSGVRASVVSEASTRSTADQALSSKIDKLTADLGTTNAAIQTEQTARANADTALASTVTTLQTKVGTNTASIQEAMKSIDGIEAMYFLKTNVNGHIAGFGLVNSGTTSNFIVLSDKFMVVAPGTTPKVPFVVGQTGPGVYGVGIDGGLVVNGTIIGEALDAGTITGDKIGANQISATHLMANSVTADKIAAGTITADKIASGVISSEATRVVETEIAYAQQEMEAALAGAVNNWNTTTINGGRIQTGTISANAIAAGAITADKITANSIDASKITQNGVSIDKIASGVVTSADANSGSISVPSGGSKSIVWVSWHGDRKTKTSGDETYIESATVTISGVVSKTLTYQRTDGAWGGDSISGSYMQKVTSSGSVSVSSSGLNNFQAWVSYVTIK